MRQLTVLRAHFCRRAHKVRVENKIFLIAALPGLSDLRHLPTYRFARENEVPRGKGRGCAMRPGLFDTCLKTEDERIEDQALSFRVQRSCDTLRAER